MKQITKIGGQGRTFVARSPRGALLLGTPLGQSQVDAYVRGIQKLDFPVGVINDPRNPSRNGVPVLIIFPERSGSLIHNLRLHH